ncbi:unnamed protein product [Mytilus edulis]|uniref:VWFD domain-containing protein n=1 Tax=Mytilus edulis TaxID=6550 RepID=A0A8S3VAA4_MYTED|nr:unnamed protein product [Mytilus edulis]
MRLKLYLLVICISSKVCYSKDLACETTKQLNDWKRSVKYEPQASDLELCDNFIEEGWYKITSKAGEKCQHLVRSLGLNVAQQTRCGCQMKMFQKGEDLYPKVNDVVDRIACASNFDGDCCKQKVPIKIKNCGTYLVYHLTPPKECNTAFCFGDKLPCPAGQSSETGFPRDVEVSIINKDDEHACLPKVTVKPIVEPDIAITKGLNKNKISTTFEKVLFNCIAVKCSLQIKEAGFTSPGPEQFSDEFCWIHSPLMYLKRSSGLQNYQLVIFDKLSLIVNERRKTTRDIRTELKMTWKKPLKTIVHQKDFSVDEGKSVQVPVELTIPIGCSYQLIFEIVTVTGAIDNMVNFEDRVTALRLYHDMNKVKTSAEELDFWRGVTLEDIRFRIKDKDEKLLGNICSSNNDPHVTTFERIIEIHILRLLLRSFSFHQKEGEYLLYRNKKVPVEITTMAGSKINIHLTQVYHFFGIRTFTITASQIDRDNTEGICGTLDGDSRNDLTPKGGNTPFHPEVSLKN